MDDWQERCEELLGEIRHSIKRLKEAREAGDEKRRREMIRVLKVEIQAFVLLVEESPE